MNFLSIIIFALSIFFIISILIQQEERKNSSLSIESSKFFSTNLEKFTFILFAFQFFFLLLQVKFNLF